MENVSSFESDNRLRGKAMSKKGLLLIGFAWVMEVVGVSAGVINSTYTTFGDDLPHSIWGYVPAVPMVALAVAELGRVPLASVFFHRHKLTQVTAIIGLAALGYLAVENWTFGFERIVDLRLNPVNASAREVLRTKAELSALEEQNSRLTDGSRQKRDELRRAIDQRDSSITDLTGQLSREADTHQKNLEGIREACRIIRDKCMLIRSQSEDARYEKEVATLGKSLHGEREERNNLQSQIDTLVSKDASEAAQLSQRIASAKASVSDAQQAFRTAADKNQIYRLAASWYGVSTSDVTAAQFASARWVFSTLSAIAVAFAGSIAALVYYARARVPGVPTAFGLMLTKLLRARRAYYARLRKVVVREVPGPEKVIYREGTAPPTVVEKIVEKIRFIDRIILIPRWGIKAPTYINSLFESNERSGESNSEEKDNVDAASNVRPLKQKVV